MVHQTKNNASFEMPFIKKKKIEHRFSDKLTRRCFPSQHVTCQKKKIVRGLIANPV